MVMKYLKDFAEELAEAHKQEFISGIEPDSESFIRDSERYQTLMDLVNLEYEDMEKFYAETSMGQTDSIAE